MRVGPVSFVNQRPSGYFEGRSIYEGFELLVSGELPGMARRHTIGLVLAIDPARFTRSRRYRTYRPSAQCLTP